MPGSSIIDALQCEPADTYHARANEYLSSHRLADFRKCPLLYRRKQLGLIEDVDRPAYRVGRAAHTLILEGRERFAAAYATGGPTNPATGQPYGPRTKAYRQWADSLDKEVLTESDALLCAQMETGVSANPVAGELLADGVPEGVVRAAYCAYPCQARIDWVNPEWGIVDLKTADDMTWFESDARRFGYAHQLAFYRAVLMAALQANAPAESPGFCQGTPCVPVYLVAVEKREPYRCGVWRVGEGVLAQAQKENEEAIERIKDCEERDEWPTGYEDLRNLDYI